MILDNKNENQKVYEWVREYTETGNKEAVEFLKQEKVQTKTLEPNFCHAKVYLFVTEAGIGLKKTNNVELNIAETGNNNQYQELSKLNFSVINFFQNRIIRNSTDKWDGWKIQSFTTLSTIFSKKGF